MRGERVVVAHSLGAIAWLHAADRGTTADRVLLVSPPGPSAFAWDVIAPFDPAGLDQPISARLACSDNDPYCPEGAADAYGHLLRGDVDVLPGAGHITVADGYGPWPSASAWCLDPSTRLTTR
ncbi:alpha/beta hydrolase [Hamadaea sp.]|uniref:RBBP9/YdeN family alpha/beta hydrolase n=1 Tax=Hamadaea sp. TaxID=2024425 RepID=UPI0025BCD707|nr:alpha/beta hydrolase [Hamadaea sp.]